MAGHLIVSIFVLVALTHLYVNIRLTGDIIGWVPERKRWNALLCLVWLLPVAGSFHVYRRLAPAWFMPDREVGDNQSAVSSGLLGLDVIFNPSARNIGEAHRKDEISIEAEGEMYDRKLPDFIEIKPAENPMEDGDSNAA